MFVLCADMSMMRRGKRRLFPICLIPGNVPYARRQRQPLSPKRRRKALSLRQSPLLLRNEYRFRRRALHKAFRRPAGRLVLKSGKRLREAVPREEASLFTRLAEHFTQSTPPDPETSMEALSALMAEDIEKGYPALRSAADALDDRGQSDLCMGEKVTRMLLSCSPSTRARARPF